MQPIHVMEPLLVLGILLREGSPIAGLDFILKGVHPGAELPVPDGISGLLSLESLSFQSCQLTLKLVNEFDVPVYELIQ